MQQIKCPKCGTLFNVDENDYAAILQQVKTAEFKKELEERLQAEKVVLNERLQTAKNDLETLRQQKDAEKQLALVQKESELTSLKEQLKSKDQEKNSAIQNAIQSKELELAKKTSEVEQLKKEKENETLQAQKRYDDMLRLKNDEIEQYKDLKARLSTKMLGETLEQHCLALYEQYIRPCLPEIEFGKDNQVVEGSKGDFVLRESEGDTEFFSIMFEMKNEGDTTSTKHKNEDFFAKLDEDRRKKGCEYAVLVSLLEPDSEIYNQGIVNVSHKYPKMYVVRPQFFIPMIHILRSAAKDSLEARRQLQIARSKDLDITHFEEKLNSLTGKISKDYDLAGKQFEKSLEAIDASIKKLQDVKAALETCRKHLGAAVNVTEDLSIRKLTYGNPTMKKEFQKLGNTPDAEFSIAGEQEEENQN